MTDRSDFDTSSLDLDAFHEWVERTAESEGTSPEAIIQQLMSTYWILNELTETLEETPYEHLLEQGTDDGQEDEERETDASSDEGKSEIVDVIKAIAELNNQPGAAEPERAGGTIDPKLVDVIEALQAHATQPSAPPDPNVTQLTFQVERLRNELASLGEDVEDVEDTLDAVQETTEREVQDVVGRVEDVEGTTETLEEQFRSIADRHERDLSNLGETVDGLEEALTRKADRESLAGLESRVDGDHAATRERVDAVEETFEEAYADIKRILSYLLDASSEHGTMLDVLVEAYESELEELVVAHEDARRLQAIKGMANRQGVDTAVCEACEGSFDVALLAEPRCPHCERDIDRFDSESFLWRTKYVAKPRQYPAESDHRPIRERIDEVLSAPDATHGPTAESLDDGN